MFPKGLVHGFGKKLAFFHVFILGKIGQENVSYDIRKTEESLSRI